MNEEEFMRYARSEFSIAKSEILKLEPSEALVRFYGRLDDAISTSTNAALVKPACRAGCSYCCYYKVEAKAAEILQIQKYVNSRFSPKQKEKALNQARQNVQQARNLSYEQHLATNQQCPFLMQDKCSIYSVRPSKCRNFHAKDVDGCKTSYEEPHNLSLPNSFIPEVFVAANGTTDGFEQAIHEAGMDSRTYDLNSAFLEAMENTKAAKRFKSGKKTFISAKIVAEPENGAP